MLYMNIKMYVINSCSIYVKVNRNLVSVLLKPFCKLRQFLSPSWESN